MPNARGSGIGYKKEEADCRVVEECERRTCLDRPVERGAGADSGSDGGMRRAGIDWFLAAALGAALACACSSKGGTEPDGGIDGGSDADTDSDSDTDWPTDTDTLVYDGGPLIDCEGEPQEGEVCIPGGTYLMGCMPYDDQCENNEKPMVEVTLSPFFIEVEESSYEDLLPFLNSLHDGYIREEMRVRVDDVEETIIWSTNLFGGAPIRLNGDDEYEWIPFLDEEGVCTERDVDAVAGGFSWHGAKLFCEWKGKDLPTEAQWEAAARGQTILIWPCAWYHKECWYGIYDCCDGLGECYNSLCGECCIPFPTDEQGYCESPFGVKGLYANAWEYVLDWIDEDHSWCEDGCIDPEPTAGDYPIIKGGSVKTFAVKTRISQRSWVTDPMPSGRFGVRCARPDTPIEEDAGSDSGPDGGK